MTGPHAGLPDVPPLNGSPDPDQLIRGPNSFPPEQLGPLLCDFAGRHPFAPEGMHGASVSGPVLVAGRGGRRAPAYVGFVRQTHDDGGTANACTNPEYCSLQASATEIGR
jgi:hypothetical protein